MDYISVAEAAKRWGISERSVRNYCKLGRIEGAFLTGKTWNIPEIATKPDRINKRDQVPTCLLSRLKAEKKAGLHGGIYHRVQIDLTYNSNHMGGSKLTHDQTRYIFETNTLGLTEAVKVDDVVETANHFKCIDMIIDGAAHAPSEKFIKQLHAVLKNGTTDSRKAWFAVGDYKRVPNEVGGKDTTAPEDVAGQMKKLLAEYNSAAGDKSFDDLLDFHYRFESIHPFQDGNGRIGRLLLFKECLRHGIVPFIIAYDMKMFYYRSLQNWSTERGYLRDTCLTAQDRFKKVLDYFNVPYIKP